MSLEGPASVIDTSLFNGRVIHCFVADNAMILNSQQNILSSAQDLIAEILKWKISYMPSLFT